MKLPIELTILILNKIKDIRKRIFLFKILNIAIPLSNWKEFHEFKFSKVLNKIKIKPIIGIYQLIAYGPRGIFLSL